ncbi:MAG: DUF885 domain-containing protein [Chloroflexi bacterium]|nr:DUF885 domain-containing protein [Chloroflexota bacterium]MDA1220260.1 DUF885 domain-containing protein [Chloroflexota bacterium]
MPANRAFQAFADLAQHQIREYWDFYPTAGSRIGQHEYDGRLPDLSPGKVRRRIEGLRHGMAQLSGIPHDTLESPQRLSRHLLELFLKRELFNLEEMRPVQNNPMRQVGFLNVGGYVRRDYAPLADRIRAATQSLQQVPDFLQVLDTYLASTIGRPVLEMSIESYSGMARFYRVDLAEAVVGFGDQSILNEFNVARERAAVALDNFVESLRDRLRGSSDDFAIGSGMYSAMLSTGEGLDLPLSQIVELGQANLRNNLERLSEVCTSINPAQSVREIVAKIGQNHPAPQALIAETREMLEGIRQSLIDLDLISVPSEDRCQVIETPTYMRYAFAAMDSPGSLETKATESFYYVTPVEDDWTVQQQEEWLSNFNYSTLRIISIHEVYPGHFVHHLHSRYGQPLPLVNRVAASYAFTEGWAHYTEQMMVETDYGKNDPTLLVTQLLEALVRNCRYLCSLGMHTQGMSVDEATRFFMDHAYMEELPARREAMRGTFDPGYLNYTLGKMMILKLRDDYRKEQGAAYSLKGFHDELLSYGAPPLPLLRDVMLKGGGSPL